MTKIREKIQEDPHYFFKLEKEIEKKYGEAAIQSLKDDWGEEKDQEYHEQIREMYDKWRSLEEHGEPREINGYLARGKLFNKDIRVCKHCNKLSFSSDDDFYLYKFGVCFLCFDKIGSKLQKEEKDNG